MSPFQAWWIAAVPLTRFCVELVEIPRANSFCSRSVSLEISSSLGSVVLSSHPLIRFASPIALLVVVEDEHAPLAVRVREVVPGARHSRNLVIAPGDSGRVIRVGDRELGLRVPPAGVVERGDALRVLQIRAVEVRQEALRVQAVRVLGRGPDQVVASARAELRHHRLEVVEVDLVHLDAVLLRKGLLELGVHVLSPVVDQEVAVHLGLDGQAALWRVDRSRDRAAREAVRPERANGRGPQSLPPGEGCAEIDDCHSAIHATPMPPGLQLRSR